MDYIIYIYLFNQIKRKNGYHRPYSLRLYKPIKNRCFGGDFLFFRDTGCVALGEIPVNTVDCISLGIAQNIKTKL